MILTSAFAAPTGSPAAIMLFASHGLRKASGRLFLEAAREGFDPDAIGQAMASESGMSPGSAGLHS